MKKVTDLALAEFFGVTPMTLRNYKQSDKEETRKRYEAYKAFYTAELLKEEAAAVEEEKATIMEEIFSKIEDLKNLSDKINPIS